MNDKLNEPIELALKPGASSSSKRQRWNPKDHKKWIKKVYGSKVYPSSEKELAAARAERKLM